MNTIQQGDGGAGGSSERAAGLTFSVGVMLKVFLSIQLSAVMFYAQERQYRHMQTCLLDLLRLFGTDPVLLFWRAFSIVLEGMF